MTVFNTLSKDIGLNHIRKIRGVAKYFMERVNDNAFNHFMHSCKIHA